jgi:hypothetical protein
MFKRIGFSLLAAVVLLCGLYLAVVFQWSYSSGERAGWVQKFSRKGWICKTWEGEIAMVTLPGSVPDKFPFTVRDDAVAAQITRTVGQRVTLHYEQHRGLPGSCFGETEYWVDSVTLVPWQPFGGQPGGQPGEPPDARPAPGAAAPAPGTAPAVPPPQSPATGNPGAAPAAPATPAPTPAAPAAPAS